MTCPFLHVHVYCKYTHPAQNLMVHLIHVHICGCILKKGGGGDSPCVGILCTCEAIGKKSTLLIISANHETVSL